ncbi:MAG: DNA-protecting protein DprA [bacterium]|nr:DNA-protecting protein DprA [bacterium]
MKDREDYLLLLNNVFCDIPALVLELSRCFKNISDFIKGQDKFFRNRRFSIERQGDFKKRTTAFSADDFRIKIKKIGIEVLYEHSEQYPEILKQIDDFPPVLYYQGDVSTLSSEMLGVVGVRAVSEYGEAVTRALVTDLAGFFVVVSGLAHGIDTVAHKAALKQGCKTVAVVGTGLDTVYPVANKELYKEICNKGVVISEYPPGIKGRPYRFPQRNRLISGLSKGIIVCEAGIKSGSLITAQRAIEQNREVFAVPGSIFSDSTAGTHKLIQDGAKLVCTAEDVLQEFNYLMQFRKKRPLKSNPVIYSMESKREVEEKDLDLTKEESIVWKCLSLEPVHVDKIVCRSELSVHQVLQYLTLFEVKDMVEQLPGKLFKKRE